MASNAPALVLVIDYSQSLDHVCGAVFLLNFVMPPFPQIVSSSTKDTSVLNWVRCYVT